MTRSLKRKDVDVKEVAVSCQLRWQAIHAWVTPVTFELPGRCYFSSHQRSLPLLSLLLFIFVVRSGQLLAKA
jgi:hypothetical protein